MANAKKTSETAKTANTAKPEKSGRSRKSSPNKKSRTQAAKKKAPSKSAKVLRRQREVRRARIFIGCVIAAAILIIALAIFLFKITRPVNKGTLVGVNNDVLQYQDQVEACCREYGISEYSTLLLAMMQQESSGQGTDVFQCSESPFNTEYDSSPGSITDTDYSIRVGVETFAYCLDVAGCRHISDMDALLLAIQEYNFGNNYAGWALENYGGYSLESAYAFSEMMKSQLGWSTYGDTEYVPHVLQYIEF